MSTTIADLSPTPGPDRRCRYVRVNGARCRFPSKPGSDLCSDHHFKKTYTRGRLRPSPPSTFNTVPLVRFAWADDHDSILFNCNQIALARVHDTINARQAGALNAVMHTAQRSLRQKFLHERFEAQERERAAAAARSSVASSGNAVPASAPEDPRADFVTDYVLDTDGMPLALPDQPDTPASADIPESANAPGAPSLSSCAVQEDRVGSADTPDHQKNEKELDPVWIARKRDAILYLREYYKNDPVMLAEIETYPTARYAPKPKYEPESEPILLPALTACAEPQPSSDPVTRIPCIKYLQPESLPHMCTEAPAKFPVCHT